MAKIKYKYMIATDRDGTIDKMDKNSKEDSPIIDHSINTALAIAKVNNCMSVLISGRTLDDNLQDLKTHSIGKFDYIVGDNGATIYNTTTGEITKFNLGEPIVDTILDKINEVNENYKKYEHSSSEDIMPLDNVRFTNGEHIFTYDNPTNHEYYSEKSVKYFNSVSELKDVKDITKINLAGPKTLMQIFAAEMNNLGLKTHLLKSKFPNESSDNYILDITSSQATKGNAVKFLSEKHEVEKYYTFGNDWNDESMILETILSGNNAYIVSRNAPPEFLIFLHKKIKELKESGTKNLGKLINLPDTDINSIEAMKKTIRNEMHGPSHKPRSNLKDLYKVHSFYNNKSLIKKPSNFVPKTPTSQKNKGDR